MNAFIPIAEPNISEKEVSCVLKAFNLGNPAKVIKERFKMEEKSE